MKYLRPSGDGTYLSGEPYKMRGKKMELVPDGHNGFSGELVFSTLKETDAHLAPYSGDKTLVSIGKDGSLVPMDDSGILAELVITPPKKQYGHR